MVSARDSVHPAPHINKLNPVLNTVWVNLGKHPEVVQWCQYEFQQNVHPASHINKLNPVSNPHERAAANTNEQTVITLITPNLISCLGAFINLTANYCEDKLAAHLR